MEGTPYYCWVAVRTLAPYRVSTDSVVGVAFLLLSDSESPILHKASSDTPPVEWEEWFFTGLGRKSWLLVCSPLMVQGGGDHITGQEGWPRDGPSSCLDFFDTTVVEGEGGCLSSALGLCWYEWEWSHSFSCSV